MQLTLNGKPYRTGAGVVSVADLLRELRLTGSRSAVAVNGTVVPRTEQGGRRLVEADRVDVIGAVAGG